MPLPKGYKQKFGPAAMSFVRNIRIKQAAMAREIVRETHLSVKDGSELTGSPGQPIGPDEPAGKPHLREAIVVEEIAPNIWDIHAEGEPRAWVLQNEDGIPRTPGQLSYRLRASEGGRWSFQKTAIGFDNIVDAVRSRFAGR